MMSPRIKFDSVVSHCDNTDSSDKRQSDARRFSSVNNLTESPSSAKCVFKFFEKTQIYLTPCKLHVVDK